MKFLKSYKLFEYMVSDTSYLKRYLNMSDEDKMSGLVYQFGHLIDEYINDTGDDDILDRSGFVEGKNEYYEISDMLSKEDHKLFGEWLMTNYKKYAVNSDWPSWEYFTYHGIVKNQWLIHFSDYAPDIAKEGFKKGVFDIERLGLTTWLGDQDKNYGGYNFAYTLQDFAKYGQDRYDGPDVWKYGKEAVIFRASGVRVWHSGDEEYQTIFYGNTATNINYLEHYQGEWWIEGKNGRKLVKFDDLEQLVPWFTDNYSQYQKQLN